MDVSAIVGALESLVLERLPRGEFVRRGVLPSWCLALSAPALQGEPPFVVEEVFPFLAAFLDRAEEAWRGEQPRASSDFWTETGADGEEIHLEASAVRVGDAAVLVISRNDRLFQQQQLVLQRARELRLAHDELMWEMEQKDVLIHAIIHDLAAPLHSILGALSLLGELPLGEPGARWIRIASQAAIRQRELIREILDVFSADRGALVRSADSSGEGQDVCRAIARVMSELEPVARRRGVRLQTAPLEPPCHVVAEERRLLRVLTNLVDNALRVSPPGGAIRAVVQREEAGVTVAVEDEGPGVPAELLPQLFEKFARGGERTAGTGLGLYFCRITVEGWGGGIGYEPRAGGGARFWIRLLLAARSAGRDDRDDCQQRGERDGQAVDPGR